MEFTIYYIQQSFFLLGMFIVPLLIILLISGVLISILSTLFQIHDSSISYVSRLVITTIYFVVIGKDFYNQFITLVIRIFEGQ
jgi:flagellar biosynthesis protein FliQ